MKINEFKMEINDIYDIKEIFPRFYDDLEQLFCTPYIHLYKTNIEDVENGLWKHSDKADMTKADLVFKQIENDNHKYIVIKVNDND